MPLPVAHSLIGATVATAVDKDSGVRWRILCLSALLGVCPDFDYVLNWLHVGSGGWHHGFTHSFVFAFFLGALVSLATGSRSINRFIVFSAAVASHPLLDFLMTESGGVALWWPFTDSRYKLGAQTVIDYSWSSTSFWNAAVDILRISLIELIIFGPLLLLVVLLKRRRVW